MQSLIAEVFAARAAFPIQVEELPAVVAVRTLIADVVAAFPLVEVLPDDTVAPQQSPVITKPDPDEFGWLTHHRSVMELTGDGNVWLMVTARNALTGLPIAIQALPARDVIPNENPATRRIVGCTYAGRDLVINRGDVIHVPMNVTGRRGYLGESALRMSRPAMEAIAELYKFGRSTWAEFGAPSVKLRVPGALNTTPDADGKTEADKLREAWLGTHGGKRVPAVLWGGADAEAFGMVEDHSKLAEALQIIAADAPQAYRVPASLVNARTADGAMTYRNTQDELQRWLKLGLNGYMFRLEAAYTAMLPRGHRARFDTTEFERLDAAGQAEWLTKATGGQPWMTGDEARLIAGSRLIKAPQVNA